MFGSTQKRVFKEAKTAFEAVIYGILLNLNRCLIFGEKKHYNWRVPIFFGENYRPGILIELSLKTN